MLSRITARCLRSLTLKCSNCLQPGLLSPGIHKRWSSSDPGKQLLVDVDDKTGIATLTLNKPPVNSFTLDFSNAMINQLEKFENEKDIRGLILASSVPNIFSAGLNLEDLYNPQRDKLEHFWNGFQECMLRLYVLPFPVIAAISGHAIAGGCAMALASDYRIMSTAKSYKMGLNEAVFGLVLPFWLSEMAVCTVGQREAEKIIQFGLMYSGAEDAVRGGMVDVACTKEDVLKQAWDTLKVWLTVPDFVRTVLKQQFRMPLINKKMSRGDADTRNFVDNVMKDSVQTLIGSHLKSLKK